ncbi:MAG: transglutaminase-like cysteine peptidase [Pseudomonadales bacterium]
MLANKQFWCALLLVFCSSAVSSYACADHLEAGLFGYVQQANNDVNAFPQVATVSTRYQARNKKKTLCNRVESSHCESATWDALLEQLRVFEGQELLEQLNTAINKFNYRTDKNNYAQDDYWATPQELIKNGGDCEDFAMAKMLALQHLGVAAQSMRIVVLQDTATAQPHAVLAVSRGQDTLILDNKTDTLFSDKQLAHYVPLYSVNEHQWWLHMPLEVAERLFVQTASTTGSAGQISGAIVSR